MTRSAALSLVFLASVTLVTNNCIQLRASTPTCAVTTKAAQRACTGDKVGESCKVVTDEFGTSSCEKLIVYIEIFVDYFGCVHSVPPPVGPPSGALGTICVGAWTQQPDGQLVPVEKACAVTTPCVFGRSIYDNPICYKGDPKHGKAPINTTIPCAYIPE